MIMRITVIVLLLVALGSAAIPVLAVPTRIAADYERTVAQFSKAIEVCQRFIGQRGGYDVVFRRDPTRPLIDSNGQIITSVGIQNGLLVQGIIWSDARPLAIVDDELYGEEEVIGPYRIVRIQRDGVVAQRDREELWVPLDQGMELARSAVSITTSGQP